MYYYIPLWEWTHRNTSLWCMSVITVSAILKRVFLCKMKQRARFNPTLCKICCNVTFILEVGFNLDNLNLWIGDVANWKHHQWLDEISIFFYPYYLREISKVVFKKTLACNTPSKLSAILFAQQTLAARFIQHKLVINAHVSDIVFLQTTLLISCIVWVKIIKISSSLCWRFELATSAIALQSFGRYLTLILCIFLYITEPLPRIPTAVGQLSTTELLWWRIVMDDQNFYLSNMMSMWSMFL